MAVSVQHDGMTITSSSDNADQVLAGLQAADAASQEHKPEPAQTETAGAADAASGAAVSQATAEAKPAAQPSEPVEVVAEDPEPPQPRNEHGQFQSRHKKGTWQYRLDKKTWQAAEALRTLESERQERQRVQRELEDLRRGSVSSQTPAANQPQPNPADPNEPKLEDYPTYEAWNADLIDYRVAKALKARDDAANHRAFMGERAQLGQTFQQRKAEFAKTVADFDEVVDTDDISLSPVMCEALVTSEHGPAIAYFLGKHPEEADRLLHESEKIPVSAAPLMRRELERSALAFLSSTAAPSAPNPAQTRAVIRQAAPAPIKPVGSGLSVADTAPDDLPFGKEYVERMNRRELDQLKAKSGR